MGAKPDTEIIEGRRHERTRRGRHRHVVRELGVLAGSDLLGIRVWVRVRALGRVSE